MINGSLSFFEQIIRKNLQKHLETDVFPFLSLPPIIHISKIEIMPKVFH